MLRHMSSMKKILPVLTCLAMLAGGRPCMRKMQVRRLQRRRLQKRPAAPLQRRQPLPHRRRSIPAIRPGCWSRRPWCWAMTAPGVALFYGGMVRGKNALSVILQSFIILCLISVQWVLWGYSLAFGPDVGPYHRFACMVRAQRGWIRTQSRLCRHHTAPGIHALPDDVRSDHAGADYRCICRPDEVQRVYLVHAAVGDFHLRSTRALGVGVGGWVRNLGALDFAGGTVVHISSGISGLACALVIKKRLGHGKEGMHPHNLPMTILGASLLWFGWFGFNAGSALASGALATSAFTATNTATAASALAWMVAEWIYRGKPSALGAASGAVAGLVAITPASGFVGPISSIWIGIGAGVICYIAVMLKPLFGYDDALDAFGVHGIGGTWGALATGLFASKAINSAGADGLFFGNPAQLGIQAMAVLISWVFCFVGTLIILAIVAGITGLRVTEEEERLGLDLSQHDEKAYS